MTDDLIAFLRARLDEDEQAARAAGADSWMVRDNTVDTVAIYDSHRDPVVYDEGAPSAGQMRHIARHDPARVLAEVDAKRMLLAAFTTQAEMYARATEAARQPGRNSDALEALGHASARAALGTVLRDFAAVYADHPDYRPEWEPR